MTTILQNVAAVVTLPQIRRGSSRLFLHTEEAGEYDYHNFTIRIHYSSLWSGGNRKGCINAHVTFQHIY
jgi:hypothetical protein